jgi:hypothetical protein
MFNWEYVEPRTNSYLLAAGLENLGVPIRAARNVKCTGEHRKLLGSIPEQKQSHQILNYPEDHVNMYTLRRAPITIIFFRSQRPIKKTESREYRHVGLCMFRSDNVLAEVL